MVALCLVLFFRMIVLDCLIGVVNMESLENKLFNISSNSALDD